jgi:hypothetical protein
VVDGRWYVAGGRWGKAGFRCQGLNQDSGFRSQESAVRSQNEEHPLSADCLLLIADCLLNLRGVRAGGTLGPRSSLGHDVLSTRKEETVVTLKMTDRRGNVVENKGQGLEATGRDGNVIENKGSYALKAGMLLKIKELHGMS